MRNSKFKIQYRRLVSNEMKLKYVRIGDTVQNVDGKDYLEIFTRDLYFEKLDKAIKTYIRLKRKGHKNVMISKGNFNVEEYGI